MAVSRWSFSHKIYFLAALAMLAFYSDPAATQTQTVQTEAVPVAVTSLASGLVHPWGMAFFPDGRLLVTERAGRLRILGLDNTLSASLLTGSRLPVRNVFPSGFVSAMWSRRRTGRFMC